MRAIGWIRGRPSSRPSQTSPGVRSQMAMIHRAIRAYEEAALRINGIQPTAHVLDPGAEAGQHIRLEIDVTELDRASPGGTEEPAVLPLDARVTDGALGVVPDCERRTHF